MRYTRYDFDTSAEYINYCRKDLESRNAVRDELRKAYARLGQEQLGVLHRKGTPCFNSVLCLIRDMGYVVHPE